MRLKKICEFYLISLINIETVSEILTIGELFQGEKLKEKCINFIIMNFDRVSKTNTFEEMARNNVELLFEILRKRWKCRS